MMRVVTMRVVTMHSTDVEVAFILRMRSRMRIPSTVARSRRSGPARDSARAAWTVTRPGPAARSLGLGRDLADSDSEKSEIR